MFKVLLLIVPIFLSVSCNKSKDDKDIINPPQPPAKESPGVLVPEGPASPVVTPVPTVPPVVTPVPTVPPVVTPVPVIPVVPAPPVVSPEPVTPITPPVPVVTIPIPMTLEEVLNIIQDYPIKIVATYKDLSWNLNRPLEDSEIERGQALARELALEVDSYNKNSIASDFVEDFIKSEELSSKYCHNSKQKEVTGFNGNSYDISKGRGNYLITDLSNGKVQLQTYKKFKDACLSLTYGALEEKYKELVLKHPESFNFPVKYENQDSDDDNKGNGIIFSAKGVASGSFREDGDE